MENTPVIGLLGGGQLGRMLCQAASPLGIEIAVLDEEHCPARQVNSNPRNVTGSFKDPEKIRKLARNCDVLTVEIEHVDTEVLEEIATQGIAVVGADGRTATRKVAVHPSWKTIRLVQNKFDQKEHLRRNAARISPNQEHVVVQQMMIGLGGAVTDGLVRAADEFGFPFMLKSCRDSYDGRGNMKINSADDFPDAVRVMGDRASYAEKWVKFDRELAVMVVRHEDDEGILTQCLPFPVVETVHQDSICTEVHMPPSSLAERVCEKAKEIACKVVSTLWGRGVFAVEMFLLNDGETILINEIAPRPHNSGHYTIEAVPYMSQFKAQLYAILNWPISRQLMPRVKEALMLNILGGARPDSHQGLINQVLVPMLDYIHVYLHMYGKSSKPGRKIGHITITSSADDVDIPSAAQSLCNEIDRIRQERMLTPPPPQTSKTQTSDDQQPQQQPQQPATQPTPLVLVTMGSDSDLPKLSAGLAILDQFKVPYALDITSAHRTPDYMGQVAKEAAKRGIRVIIAAAGGAAHLPGMLSSHTPLPVIGVPVATSHLDGNDSLLSIVQMPRGVPTATVGINNSTNAALLAIRVLGSFMSEYQSAMVAYQATMEKDVHAKAERLQTLGYRRYLDQAG